MHPLANSPTGLPIDALLQRQIHLVTGKGGVGKSVLACALAAHFMSQQKRVLLVQVNAKDSHADLLGIAPVSDDILEISPQLSVVNINPEQSLKEYALMHLKFETLYKTVFENRFTQAFLRFIPSLAQLNMMGKIWFHAEEKDNEHFRYDHVVIDAPSTGHALDLLRVSQVVNDVTPKGPMAEKTRQMQATFQDPARSCMHVITLAEEMPANETQELLHKTKHENLIPLGMVVVNQLREQLFDTAQETWLQSESAKQNNSCFENLKDETLRAVLLAGTRRRAREILEKEQSARLSEEALKIPRITFPFIAKSPFRRAQIDVLARRIQFEREART